MDHSKRCAPITMQSNQAARPTRRCDMDVQAIDHTHQEPASVRDIAEKMLAFHTDGTVIATAEVLGLDLNQLWDLDIKLGAQSVITANSQIEQYPSILTMGHSSNA